MTDSVLRLDVGLGPDAEPSELDEAARGLRSELLALDVQDVRRLTGGPPPEGARGIDVAIVSALAVTAAKEVIAAVVRTAASWVGRRPSSSVTLTIGEDSLVLSNASDEDQRRLVELFVARHSASQA